SARGGRRLMRGAAGLAVLTAGAILTFAVSAQVPGINLRITGVIIMIAGVVAMITPARAAQWARSPSWPLRRVREASADEADDYPSPGSLLQAPAVLAAEVLRGAGVGLAAPPGQANHGAQGPGPERPERPDRPTPGSARQDGHNGRV